LTMRVFAAPFKGAAPNASVLFGVELNGRDLQLSPNDKIQLSYFALDASGKIKGGNTDSLSMSNLKPETKARIEQTGLRLLTRLDLPPGRYQVRFAAHALKGSVANFYSQSAVAAALRLEMMGRDNNLEGWQEALATLERELAHVVAGLERMLEPEPAHP